MRKPSTSSSDTTRTATPAVAQQPKALRRSARLQPTVIPKEPEPSLTKAKKRRPVTQLAQSTTVDALSSPRALRSQKRNREPEQKVFATAPITALKKRKTRTVTVESDDLVVKRKKKEGSTCIVLDAVISKHVAKAKSAPITRSSAVPATRIATRSATRLALQDSDSKPTPGHVTLTPHSPPASPPSSPPLNPATYPIPLDIVDIGVSTPSTCPPPSPTLADSVTNWNTIPNCDLTHANPTPDLAFDPNAFFTPDNNTIHSPLQDASQHLVWTNNGSNNYYQSQPELLPPPRRPRQQPLWVMACKLRVFELEKYYPRNVIRSIVDQQAKDYYSIHGPPPDWNPQFSQAESKIEDHLLPPENTSDDDQDLFRSCTPRVPEADDDTDDDTEDSDEYEGYGGDVMQLDVMNPMKEDGFNAELTSSLSFNGNSCDSMEDWSNVQSTSPLMTSFALPQSEPTSPLMFSDPSLNVLPSPPATNLYSETLPHMMPISPNFMPIFPMTLPPLSSVKVMSLRSMFDVMANPLEEEDDPEPAFGNDAMLSSSMGMTHDVYPIQKRKRRRDGMGNGTPVDPLRRAMWASAGRGGVWELDNASLNFGNGLGLDGIMNDVSPSGNSMQVDLNPLLTGDMEGAAKHFAAFQQVYEVISGTSTGYST